MSTDRKYNLNNRNYRNTYAQRRAEKEYLLLWDKFIKLNKGNPLDSDNADSKLYLSKKLVSLYNDTSDDFKKDNKKEFERSVNNVRHETYWSDRRSKARPASVKKNNDDNDRYRPDTHELDYKKTYNKPKVPVSIKSNPAYSLGGGEYDPTKNKLKDLESKLDNAELNKLTLLSELSNKGDSTNTNIVKQQLSESDTLIKLLKGDIDNLKTKDDKPTSNSIKPSFTRPEYLDIYNPKPKPIHKDTASNNTIKKTIGRDSVLRKDNNVPKDSVTAKLDTLTKQLDTIAKAVNAPIDTTRTPKSTRDSIMNQPSDTLSLRPNDTIENVANDTASKLTSSPDEAAYIRDSLIKTGESFAQKYAKSKQAGLKEFTFNGRKIAVKHSDTPNYTKAESEGVSTIQRREYVDKDNNVISTNDINVEQESPNYQTGTYKSGFNPNGGVQLHPNQPEQNLRMGGRRIMDVGGQSFKSGREQAASIGNYRATNAATYNRATAAGTAGKTVGTMAVGVGSAAISAASAAAATGTMLTTAGALAAIPVAGWIGAGALAVGAGVKHFFDRKKKRKAQVEEQKRVNLEQQRNAAGYMTADENRLVQEQKLQTGAMSYYRTGGKLKMDNGGVMDGGQLQPTSSNTGQYEGASHEQGGIDVGGNTEVEGGESVMSLPDSDLIFSDTLTHQGRTFSDISKPLMERKGQLESQIPMLQGLVQGSLTKLDKSYYRTNVNTNSRNAEKLSIKAQQKAAEIDEIENQLLQLYNLQESTKGQEGEPVNPQQEATDPQQVGQEALMQGQGMMRCGGKRKMYNGGNSGVSQVLANGTPYRPELMPMQQTSQSLAPVSAPGVLGAGKTSGLDLLNSGIQGTVGMLNSLYRNGGKRQMAEGGSVIDYANEMPLNLLNGDNQDDYGDTYKFNKPIVPAGQDQMIMRNGGTRLMAEGGTRWSRFIDSARDSINNLGVPGNMTGTAIQAGMNTIGTFGNAIGNRRIIKQMERDVPTNTNPYKAQMLNTNYEVDDMLDEVTAQQRGIEKRITGNASNSNLARELIVGTRLRSGRQRNSIRSEKKNKETELRNKNVEIGNQATMANLEIDRQNADAKREHRMGIASAKSQNQAAMWQGLQGVGNNIAEGAFQKQSINAIMKTAPKDVREDMGLKAGEKLDFDSKSHTIGKHSTRAKSPDKEPSDRTLLRQAKREDRKYKNYFKKEEKDKSKKNKIMSKLSSKELSIIDEIVRRGIR